MGTGPSNLELRLENNGVSKEDFIYIRDELDSFVKTYLDDPKAAPKSLQIRARGITPILAKLIDISAGTGLGQFVNIFYEMAPAFLETNDSVTQTMVRQTGRQLIGSAGAPDSWRNHDDTPTADYARYKMFVQRANESGYPEHFIAFELIVRHMEGAKPEEIQSLIEDAETLNELDKEHFVRLIVAHATGEFASLDNAFTERITRTFSKFLQDHAASMAWIFESDTET